MAEKTIYSTKSAYVRESDPDTNYGSETTLIWGTYANKDIDAFIEFDLSGISSVESAYLKVNIYNFIGGGKDADVKKVTSSWNEGDVTWNTKPSTTGSYGTLEGNSTGEQPVDVKTLVEEWLAGSNYGLMLDAISPESDTNSKCRSDDYETESERPRLVITYKPGGGFFIFLAEAFKKHNKLWRPKLAIPKLGYQI